MKKLYSSNWKWLKIAMNHQTTWNKMLVLMGTLRRINVKHETSVKKRTILTTCKVWSLCQNNRRKRGLCTMRTKMSSKSEINTDSVSVTECFFYILVTPWPTHCVISSSIAIATRCRSWSLQAVSQSQWPKVGLINDHQTDHRLCDWRIRMCGKTKNSWSTINSEHQINPTLTNRRLKLI